MLHVGATTVTYMRACKLGKAGDEGEARLGGGIQGTGTVGRSGSGIAGTNGHYYGYAIDPVSLETRA
jgi:hypothetical protein